jgi:glycerol-3-phosphate O-acyltransferase
MPAKKRFKTPDNGKKLGEAAHLRRLLRGNFHHYSTLFYGRFSLVLDIVFNFWFGAAYISEADREELRRAADQGAICYVIRNASRLEYLRIAFILRRDGLAPPQFAHYLSVYLWQPWATTLRRLVGTVVSVLEKKGYPNPYRNGYVEDLMQKRVPMLLPLLQFSGAPRRFSRGKDRIDPLVEMMRIRRELEIPVILVPLVPIYGRRPDRETRSMLDMIAGPSDNPGRLRRMWMALRNRKSTSIKVAQAHSLEDLEDAVEMKTPSLADPDPEKSYHIRQTLLERIETERRVVLGPARKSREEMIELVLHDSDFVARLMEYCKTNEEPFIETRRRARRYLEEMVADLRPGAVRLFVSLLNRLLPRVYESIVVDEIGLEKVRRTMRRSPVVFVPSHKSHIDYLILNYILDQKHMWLPLTVSGINLNFWPIGSLFRGAGAFFIRRAFRGKRIYTLCLTKYIEMSLREGLGLTFFVEGGRSRIGKLIPPKTGFIQYLLEAADHVKGQDVAFVPVSIGYERIFEERFYTNEAAGRPNEGENLRTMLRHRRLLTKSRGRVWIDFADPISLNHLVWATGDKIEGERRSERRQLANHVAHRVVHDINQRQPVTLYAVVAEALLAGTRRGIPSEVVRRRFELLVDYLRERRAHLPERPVSVETILGTMVAEKILTFEEDEDGNEPPFYYLEESNRLRLTMYANTVVPHHPSMSLLGLALLGSSDPQDHDELFEAFLFLIRLLKREFVFGPTPDRTRAETHADFDRALGLFEGHGWVEKRPTGFALSGDDGRFAAETFAAVVSGYVESYYLAARAMIKQKAEERSDKDVIKAALKKGRRLLSMGELDHPEAVNKLILENAIRHYADLNLLRTEYRLGEKSKSAGRTYQVADFVQLRDVVEQTRRYVTRAK